MPGPHDIKKIFVDPECFAFDDKASLVSQEMMTEIYVTGLPDTFDAESAMSAYKNRMFTIDPEVPECAWMTASTSAGLHLVMAFNGAVAIDDTRETLIAVVEEELDRLGRTAGAKVYGIRTTSNDQFPLIDSIIKSSRPSGP